jgi:hypothetical protein
MNINMIEYEQQLTELINSNDESNWILAVEIGLSLNDNNVDTLLFNLLTSKDVKLHKEKMNDIFNKSGLIPIGRTLTEVTITRLLEQVCRTMINGRI